MRLNTIKCKFTFKIHYLWGHTSVVKYLLTYGQPEFYPQKPYGLTRNSGISFEWNARCGPKVKIFVFFE